MVRKTVLEKIGDDWVVLIRVVNRKEFQYKIIC